MPCWIGGKEQNVGSLEAVSKTSLTDVNVYTIRPLKRQPERKYRIPSLKELVSKITRENRYKEVLTGAARGKEKVK